MGAARAGIARRSRSWRLAADLWCARWFWPRDDGHAARAFRSGDAGRDRRRRAAGPDAAPGIIWRAGSTSAAHAASALGLLSLAAGVRRRLLRRVGPATSGRRVRRGHRQSAVGDAARGSGRAEPSPDASQRRLVRFIRESGLYPACDRGHVNLYQPFLERALSLARPGGRIGLILPSGLATDDGATMLRAKLLECACTDTLVGIDNARGDLPHSSRRAVPGGLRDDGAAHR